AAFAEECLSRATLTMRTLVSVPIQGHHSRLLEPGESRNMLQELRSSGKVPSDLFKQVRRDIIANLPYSPPQMTHPDFLPREIEFLTRMLLSTVIDADRLSTEHHFNRTRYHLRGRSTQAGALGPALFSHIESKRDATTDLNRIRHEVYECCRTAAHGPSGMYRLTVPTGGGKTLSSLAFALEHLHGREGIVVVALPYTSIIEQTAKEYRNVPDIGPENVLEHHSAIKVRGTENGDEAAIRLELATENWDVPIVVTTTVQLLESLFSNLPSKVRKLHRLAGSVIILDEFQSIPAALLAPTMDVLRLLSTPVAEGGYSATVVLCTATQPSLDSAELRQVLEGVTIREIVPQYAEYFEKLKRVTYTWRSESLTWEDVADELRSLPCALAILNTRRDALALLDAVEGTEHLFHLSTLLCGAHRQCNLQQVRDRLASKLPVKLISTQVVECGVDFDFPTVYRAVGPLDRIVQAAGRCNRNFTMESGQVVVFEPAEGSTPTGLYKDATEKTLFVMKGRDPQELHNPDLHTDYFFKLFNDRSLDERRIQELRQQLNFPEVAKEYRLIDSPTSPVVVKYGSEWSGRLDAFRQYPSRKTWQRLQPYVVNVFDHDIRRSTNSLEEISDGLYLSHGPYSKLRGIDLGDGVWDPSDLYVG
ncbi:MAG: DEAD/DEAH box helicase, partial [Thermomicrobiales bacterium]